MLTPAQSAALRRARELAAELAELTAAVRAHLAAQAVTPPEPEAEEETRLKAGDMRDAFKAARLQSGGGPRPRWADTLLSGE